MSIQINGVRIDDSSKTFIIAEMSGNHGHDYAKAEALVLAAAEAGSDAVKAQLITPELICADIPLPFGHNPEHDVWLRGLGVTRMRDLFAQGGLPREWCAPLKALAERLGIAWICTPFSVEEAIFLVEEIGVSALKIASGDLTFTPLLRYAVSTGLPLIVSTGGATMDECDVALRNSLWNARDRLIFLHCCSVYPAPWSIVNLRCLAAMQQALGIPIGFSDHTLSTVAVPLLAVASGAVAYEKHLALADDTTSIDAGHSVSPTAFTQMVCHMRDAQAILGTGVKAPHALELHDRLWARRGKDGLRPTDEARAGRWA